MSEMGKPFLKKFWQKEQKKPENYCKNATCEQKTTSEKWKSGSKKQGLGLTMNGLGKPFRKKIRSKKSKNRLKNQSEIAACEQKTTSETANFCSTAVFALYFKIRAKKNHAAKPLAFSLHFLFRREQNHYSNLTSKNNVWTDLENHENVKDSAPMQFKIFEL